MQPVYWLCAASSYKSYLLMPRNFGTYWPRPDVAVPERERALLASVSALMDPPSPDAADPHPYADQVYVDGNVAIEPEALRDPAVACYALINPGHVHGDFVLGLVPLTASNWATALSRVAARSLRRLRAPAALALSS